MIKYKLNCKNCNLVFDSWFASSMEYEKLKKKKFVTCHQCESTNVEKTLMSPRLIGSKKKVTSDVDTKKYDRIKKTITQYQRFIKNNFEFVGENFSYEARSLHYNKKKKNIYGTASMEEFKELSDEGIDVQVVPWTDDKNN